MELKRLFTDEDAVSPVIGVILMVAITVILAAVTASFVLGLGDQQQRTTPQVSFEFDYDASPGGASSGYGLLTVTHDGGDTVESRTLYVRGTGFEPDGTYSSLSVSPDIDADDSNKDWAAAGASTEVTAGTAVTVGVENDYELSIVYEKPDGSVSATLGQDSGPES